MNVIPVIHLAKGSKVPPLQNGKLRMYSMRYCTFSHRVHLVLDAKNIPYDTVYVNLTNKPEWFLEKSPYGSTPVLELDHGVCLHESLIIADYLDEKYPQRLLHPKDPLQKAKDRLLVDRFGSILTSMFRIMLSSDQNSMDDDEQVVMQGLDRYNRELADRGTIFFGGHEPGMLDYMIWPFIERMDVVPLMGDGRCVLKTDRYKVLMEWKNAMEQDSAVKRSIMDTDGHMKYLESKRAGAIDFNTLS